MTALSFERCAVCEFVRIESARAWASARSCPTSVCRIRIGSRQPSKFPSLRGWRSQDRGGSSPPFRTILHAVRFRAARRPPSCRRRLRLRRRWASSPSAPHNLRRDTEFATRQTSSSPFIIGRIGHLRPFALRFRKARPDQLRSFHTRSRHSDSGAGKDGVRAAALV